MALGWAGLPTLWPLAGQPVHVAGGGWHTARPSACRAFVFNTQGSPVTDTRHPRRHRWSWPTRTAGDEGRSGEQLRTRLLLVASRKLCSEEIGREKPASCPETSKGCVPHGPRQAEQGGLAVRADREHGAAGRKQATLAPVSTGSAPTDHPRMAYRVRVSGKQVVQTGDHREPNGRAQARRVGSLTPTGAEGQGAHPAKTQHNRPAPREALHPHRPGPGRSCASCSCRHCGAKTPKATAWTPAKASR